MRFRMAFCAAPLLGLITAAASAQGIMGDVLSGKLINPEVGVYAWYTLTDNTTNTQLFLRQAIVGKEKVDGEKGYWVETEVIPQVGFPIVYKMLLTGPASDPENVHRILMKQGQDPVRSMPVDTLDDEGTNGQPAQELVGKEEVSTAEGTIEAEHYFVKSGKEKHEIWLNDDVRPLGLVRMVTPQGELKLQRHGKGGQDAQSAIGPEMHFGDGGEKGKSDFKVRVQQDQKQNFQGREQAE